jgi:acetyltransferase
MRVGQVALGCRGDGANTAALMEKQPSEPLQSRAWESGMSAFFRPRSVALVGASERPGSVGRALLENLSSFPGRLHVVHPTRDQVFGTRAAPSLSALGQPVDLVVLATPAVTIPDLVREAGACGVSAGIVISAGFRETGPVGVELERCVREAARSSGIRILGPNCLGLIAPHAGLNATFAACSAQPGRVAFLSQSGALCTAILDWSVQKNLGFSAFVSTGAMGDVGWADLVRYFGEDPATESIVLYMESVGDASAFMEAARTVSVRKPLVAIKVGRTAQAARAAASHTGAMTGCDAVMDAVFEQCGVVRVDTIEELFDIAEMLSKQALPAGPRLAVVTNAGGPAALATDALVRHGGQLAAFGAETVGALDRQLPAYWSRGNPVDILGDADALRYETALRTVVQDASTDGALVILTPQAMTQSEATASAVARVAGETSKLLLASWMGGDSVAAGRAVLDAAGVSSFCYPDEAARAWQYGWEYRCRRHAAEEAATAALRPRAGMDEARALVRDLLRPVRRTLSEYDAKRVLECAGIPVLKTVAAKSLEEAVACAQGIGFPVVLKLLSDTLTHKTDVGGVHLDLQNEGEVRAAWHAISSAVSAADFQGVSVQKMSERRGVELICGWSRDAQVGPVLLFGAGGIFTEVFQDRVLLIPPLSPALVLDRIRRTHIFAALGGIRNVPAVDLEELARVVVDLGELALAVPEIEEMDLNPLVAAGESVLALDARMILSGGSGAGTPGV